MAEQALDVRSVAALVRRHVHVVMGAAVVGAGLGSAFAYTHPPMYTSTSLVLMAPEVDESGRTTTRDTGTLTRVAGSDAVLGPVAEQWGGISTATLRRHVDIHAPTPDLLQFEARADAPGDAEELASAVASSWVSYQEDAASSLSAAQRDVLSARQVALEDSLATVAQEIQAARRRLASEDLRSQQGRVDATVLARLVAEQADLALQVDHVKDELAGAGLTADTSVVQPATPARRPGVLVGMIRDVGLGALAAVLLVLVLLILFRRRDKRLRLRDDLADAVGCPVVASVAGRSPRSVAGWTSLLSDHTPTAVEAWSFRRALHLMAGSGTGRPDSVTVISLADDTRALSVGPQLAAYCAGTGIPTRMIAGRGHELAATLWAACAQASTGDEIRAGLVVATQPDLGGAKELSVVLAVVDRSAPELHSLPRTAATVIAVTAGTSTADDLARLAVAADDQGIRVDWLVVVDPDELDRTTGRLLQRERQLQAALPVRLTGVASGADRAGARPEGSG